MALHKPFIAVMLIPTGIGAQIGGYGGDATPAMNLLASVVDILITHPNVANAAVFQKLPDNALYIEGYGLDQFFKGLWNLAPSRSNRIGVIFDKGISKRMLTLHLNTLAATQAVYGLDVMGYIETEVPLEVQCSWETSGGSTGELKNPEVLFKACEQLIVQGAQAIAICAQMPPLTGEEAYQNGEGADPVGGVEAILSHAVVSQFQIPCAHAPVFTEENAQPELESLVDPRAAVEYITPTFLPCILTGLARAPQFVGVHSNLNVSQVDALVVPYQALGSIPVLSAIARKIPVIEVLENKTVLTVSQQALGIKEGIIQAHSYLEVAGILQSLKQGIALSSLRPQTNRPGVLTLPDHQLQAQPY